MTENALNAKFEQIKTGLKSTIPEHSYRMWIEPLWLMKNECTNNRIVIACPNEFSRKRVSDNFLPEMQYLSEGFKVVLKVAVIVKPPPLIYLPVWPEDKLAVPSAIIRSSLFGIKSRRGNRRYFKNKKIHSWSNVEMTYTGEELDQSDLEVFMHAYGQNSRLKTPLGELVSFQRRKFLREIDRAEASKQWLLSVFSRLKATDLGVKGDGYTYHGSLIGKFLHDNDEYDYAFGLDYNFHILFQKDYTWIDKETRMALEGNLIKWVHGYISSHRATIDNPHMIGIEKLHFLCGSRQVFKLFKFNIKKIMEFFKGKGWVDYIIRPDTNVLVFWRLDNKK